MANRFTPILEQLPESPSIGFAWENIPIELYHLFDTLTYTVEEMISVKWLAVCLIAELSDEDLQECFGV